MSTPQIITTILTTPSLLTLFVYLPNFAWFFAGFWTFSLRSHLVGKAFSPSSSSAPRRRRDSNNNTTTTTTETKPADPWHQDLLIYLGAMNLALALSVLDSAARNNQPHVTSSSSGGVLPLYLRLWGAAHASQAVVGWTRVWPSGRWVWAGQLGPITYVDTALCAWDWLLVYWMG